ncbi:hypothetical protein NMY22_g19464 [Coprinellus aureogranulatus]|nr:hypothetical protein NMY22_g19464 [Coprinellus aureogranulatus]
MSALTIIVAATPSNGIGLAGTLPWRLPRELKYFAAVTSHAPTGYHNAVIMGRNTWESIPPRFRPLPGRLNVVVTRTQGYDLGVTDPAKAELAVTASSLEDALNRLKSPGLPKPVHRGFIIGGAQLYNETLKLAPSSPASYTSDDPGKTALEAYVDRILLTRVFSPDFECDVFMPEFEVGGGEDGWKQASYDELKEWTGVEVAEGVQEEKGCRYEFQMFTRS